MLSKCLECLRFAEPLSKHRLSRGLVPQPPSTPLEKLGGLTSTPLWNYLTQLSKVRKRLKWNLHTYCSRMDSKAFPLILFPLLNAAAVEVGSLNTSSLRSRCFLDGPLSLPYVGWNLRIYEDLSQEVPPPNLTTRTLGRSHFRNRKKTLWRVEWPTCNFSTCMQYWMKRKLYEIDQFVRCLPSGVKLFWLYNTLVKFILTSL